MFGNQNDQSSGQNTTDIPDESIHGVLNDGSGTPADPAATTDSGGYLVASPDSGTVAAGDQPSGQPTDQPWQHPGLPIDSTAVPISDISAAPGGANPGSPTPAPAPSADDAGNPNPSADELIDIKQKALGELSPLIDELDQSPEDKFRTMMMMIQASDNQSLVKEAYAAAHAIQDEKVRAQALLDIVNEINYFTTQHQS
jgi:hypothetical protein